jgi:predicted nucleic acid-binding protein
MIVVDTNVVSELIRPKPNALVLGWVDRNPILDTWLTAVSVAELLFGVARVPAGARKSALESAVFDVIDKDFAERVLPFDLRAAGFYGELVAARERLGRPISVADAMIAAIAISVEACLVTRNVRDFAYTGLELINPWDES